MVSSLLLLGRQRGRTKPLPFRLELLLDARRFVAVGREAYFLHFIV